MWRCRHLARLFDKAQHVCVAFEMGKFQVLLGGAREVVQGMLLLGG
jgi:hypothetical protein